MTTGYDVEIKGFAEQVKLLRGYDQIVDEELTRAMQQSTLSLVAAIKPLTPVYRGALRQSIDSEITRQAAGDIIGKVGSTLASEEYPAVMEFGRAPGQMPPPDALERWGHLKLGEDGLGFVLARAIGKKGIKGKKYMKRGYESVKSKIGMYFDEALRRITDRLAVK